MTDFKRKKGLGRGLDVLLNPDNKNIVESENDNSFQEMELTKLQAGKYQPRKQMDEGSLHELANSIKEQGVIQPILIREIKNNKKISYEIIAGERRFRAAQLIGLTTVPVVIKKIDDKAAAAIALIENIQRENLNILEESFGMKRLIEEFGLTHDQLAKSLGKSRSAISNTLRLLQLADPVQTMLKASDIDMGHARSLLALSAVDQVVLAENIVNKNLSVRETEKAVKKILSIGEIDVQHSQPLEKNEFIEKIKLQIAKILNKEVDILVKNNKKSGKVIIKFSSLEELNKISQYIKK